MRSVTTGVLACLLLAVGASPALAAAWGVDQYSSTPQQRSQQEAAMGRSFGAWSVYDGLGSARGYVATVRPALDSGKVVYLNITSTYVDHGWKRPYCWDQVAAGLYDADLSAWAAAIIRAGHQDQLVVTFEHEPLGRTNPNQPKCARDAAPAYREAFAHVKRYLHAHGVTARFTFVATAGNYASSIAGSHVLDTYVPWGYFSILGVDIYTRTSDWKGVGIKVNPFLYWRSAHMPGSPVIVPELGVDSRNAGAPEWITKVSAALGSDLGDSLIAADWNLKYPYGPHTPATEQAWLNASGGG